MALYKHLPNGLVLRVEDGATIPADPTNRDYAKFLEWQQEGNTPDAADTAPEDINSYRDSLLARGYIDSVTGHTYQCDPVSRGYWTALGTHAFINKDAVNPITYSIIAADNSVVEMSAADLFTLINGRIFPWVSAVVLYGRRLKSNGVQGDISQGWPT